MILPPIEIVAHDNVIPFKIKKRDPGELPEAPVKHGKLIDRPGVFCAQHALVLDEDSRLVECSACKKVFDGFEALLVLTNSWKRYAINHRHVRQEIKELSVERERLQKQVKNLRAQRRRALPVEIERALIALRDAFYGSPELQKHVGARDVYRALSAAIEAFDHAGDEEPPDPKDPA